MSLANTVGGLMPLAGLGLALFFAAKVTGAELPSIEAAMRGGGAPSSAASGSTTSNSASTTSTTTVNPAGPYLCGNVLYTQTGGVWNGRPYGGPPMLLSQTWLAAHSNLPAPPCTTPLPPPDSRRVLPL